MQCGQDVDASGGAVGLDESVGIGRRPENGKVGAGWLLATENEGIRSEACGTTVLCAEVTAQTRR